MIEPSQATVEAAIRSWIAEGTGIDAGLPSGQSLVLEGPFDGPAPQETYALLTTIWTNQIGTNGEHFYYDEDADTMMSRVIHSVWGNFQIDIFRQGAYDLAMTFQAWSGSQLGLMASQRRRLKFHRCSQVRKHDFEIHKAYERSAGERASFDVWLGYFQTLTQDIGIIKTTGITVNYDGLPQETITQQ